MSFSDSLLKNPEELIRTLERQMQDYSSMNLSLNMTRGKPCAEQLDLSNDLLNILESDDVDERAGFDYRNYGIIDGVPKAKSFFADLLGLSADNLIVGGNSSLNMMYDILSRAMLFGMKNSSKPWGKEERIVFLCPSPGYDRHFGVTENLGIEMIAVPMTQNGPDMDLVENLVEKDKDIRGIWCVPMYSNPDGISYSEETCKRLASMKTAAQDFTIIWDNSYFVHHLGEDQDRIPEIISLCAEYKHPDRVYEFVSTSKITWPGAGIACMAASAGNIAYQLKHIQYQSIGPDKINHLRQVAFLKNAEGVKEIMKKHAAILKPKFDLILEKLEDELGDIEGISWTRPKGGYFISIFVLPGTAREVVSLCKEAGVELTPAGSTYPYGKDPQNSNIRLAPSFPPLHEVEKAIEVFCSAVKLSAARKMLSDTI